MEYDDIKKRLSPLNEITMPVEKEQEIANVIREATHAYLDNKVAPKLGRKRRWIGNVSAVVAGAVVTAGTIIVFHTRLLENASNTSATANNITINKASVNWTIPITYTKEQLANVRAVANSVSVNAWIPSRGLPGDVLTVVKNGGNELILDYKHIWVIESSRAIAEPYSIATKQTVNVGGVPGTFIVAGNNTFIGFRKGNTFIQIENLTPGQPVSLAHMKNIAESFQSVP